MPEQRYFMRAFRASQIITHDSEGQVIYGHSVTSLEAKDKADSVGADYFNLERVGEHRPRYDYLKTGPRWYRVDKTAVREYTEQHRGRGLNRTPA